MSETLGTTLDRILRRLKRPEKSADGIDAINDAIELATITGNFARDVVESSLAIDGTVYAQSIVTSASFTRFRKVKYLRPSSYKRQLHFVESTRIFDRNGNESVDAFYVAGTNIVFKLSSYQTLMYYGYYQYPTLLVADGDTHWMLDQMQSVIRDMALGELFAGIGNDAEAARYTAIGMARLLAHISDKRDLVEA